MSALARPLKWPPIFPLDKGLVAWYPFDERSGSKLLDRSGKRNHGAITGATWVAGKRGSALSFDGLTNYVKIPHSDSINIYSGNFIIAFRIKFAAVAAGTVICKRDYTGTYEIQYDGAKFHFICRNSLLAYRQFFSAAWTPTLGVWYHVVCVYDGTNGIFYIDGAVSLATAITIEDRISDASYDVYVGMRHDASNLFSGVIGEARVYSRALNAAEVQRLVESEVMLVRH